MDSTLEEINVLNSLEDNDLVRESSNLLFIIAYS